MRRPGGGTGILLPESGRSTLIRPGSTIFPEVALTHLEDKALTTPRLCERLTEQPRR
jgi:hypothetical protein